MKFNIFQQKGDKAPILLGTTRRFNGALNVLEFEVESLREYLIRKADQVGDRVVQGPDGQENSVTSFALFNDGTELKVRTWIQPRERR